MKVAALIHFYVPHRNAGSETMLHTMLRRLVDDGHEVTAFATDIPQAGHPYVIDGVRVVPCNWVLGQQFLGQLKPDVIVSHHQNVPFAAKTAIRHGIPWVFLVHNDFEHTINQLGFAPDLTVFNTRWIQQLHQDKVPNSLVIHPPVNPEDHAAKRGDHVTLVNLNRDKGGDRLYWLAEWMPSRPFLGVEGGHGVQIRSDSCPNVEFVPQTSNMRDDVWARTRVLLMPSIYESYGMAGVEALASGIPVIAHPTPGLRESLDYAGIFVDRDDLDGYADAIEALDDPDYYAERSALALQRSEDLNPNIELDHWSGAIRSLTSEHRSSSESTRGSSYYLRAEGRTVAVSGIQAAGPA